MGAAPAPNRGCGPRGRRGSRTAAPPSSSPRLRRRRSLRGRSSLAGHGCLRAPAGTRTRNGRRRPMRANNPRNAPIGPACAEIRPSNMRFHVERNASRLKVQALVDGYRGTVSIGSSVKTRSAPSRTGSRSGPARSSGRRPPTKRPAPGRGRPPRRGPGVFAAIGRALGAFWRGLAALFGTRGPGRRPQRRYRARSRRRAPPRRVRARRHGAGFRVGRGGLVRPGRPARALPWRRWCA